MQPYGRQHRFKNAAAWGIELVDEVLAEIGRVPES